MTLGRHMNPHLSSLQSYPFQKLSQLIQSCTPSSHLSQINLSIGEPQHPAPELITAALCQNLTANLGKYPTTKGTDSLRQNIATWLIKRFQLPANTIHPNLHILPVNGTREALFAFAQCIVNNKTQESLVLMPNPFYQIYEGATLLAGAVPYFINCTEDNDFQPNFNAIPDDIWQRCELLYLCSPNNPCGTVIDLTTLQMLINKAEQFDFVIAADECYSEIYPDENQLPVGLLQACIAMGNTIFKRCVIFHSLSKRSNVPGLRSGFVAGDAAILEKFLLYRTYHGCSMSPAVQNASTVAWQDERHVQTNRELYRQKFATVLEILRPILPNLYEPPASFYLWLPTPIDDEQFAQGLFQQQHVLVLPGRYLSRDTTQGNPGINRVRIALVASVDECIEAAHRIATYCQSL